MSVYRKQTHTDQYLQFESNHPLIQKLGVVKTLFHRASSNITKESDKAAEDQHLRQALNSCGYNNWAIEKALKLGEKDSKPTEHNKNLPGKGVSTTISYHGDLSEKLKRIYKDYNISTHFKPTNTIRQVLVHPKDKQPKGHQSGIVYDVQCADNYNCTDCYIGETSQPLRKRLQQHTLGSSVSAVFDHLKASGHKADLEEVKIMDRETRWFERGVKEAIWVRAENPSLNRHGGVRIKLSHAWDRTIRTLPRKLTSSSTSDDVTSGKSPESRSTTSVPS